LLHWHDSLPKCQAVLVFGQQVVDKTRFQVFYSIKLDTLLWLLISIQHEPQIIRSEARYKMLKPIRSLPRQLLVARAIPSKSRCLSSVPRTVVVNGTDDDPRAEAWKAKKESLKLLLHKSVSNSKSLQQGSIRQQVVLSEHKTSSNDMEGSAVETSPSELKYTGNAIMPLTTHMHLVKPHEDTPRGIWPVYRLMVRSRELFLSRSDFIFQRLSILSHELSRQ
jgi:hypothetical protein